MLGLFKVVTDLLLGIVIIFIGFKVKGINKYFRLFIILSGLVEVIFGVMGLFFIIPNKTPF